MKNINLIICLLFILSIAKAELLAQSTLTATALPSVVSEGDRFELRFELNDNGRDFTPPSSFAPFKVLSGPNQSSSMQIINGSVSRSLTFSYVLEAPKKGEFKIGAASVKAADGSTIKSNQVIISVMEPSEAKKAERARQADAERSLNDQAQKILRENLYVESVMDKNSVYVGEQLTITYKLYLNRSLQVSMKDRNDPVYNGFWTQNLQAGIPKDWQMEVINGQRFQIGIVRKDVLIPQKSGKLTINPIEFEFTAALETSGGGGGRRSVWDMWDRNYKNFDYAAKSKPITLNVKPLPDNAPASFNGAVGKFNMSAWFDKTETVTGEPITLKVKVEGSGNLKLIEPLQLTFPPSFEQYEPKITENLSQDGKGTSGSRVFEYILIPRAPGDYKIAPVEFTHFDISTKDYKIEKSEQFNIKVGKGTQTTSQTQITGVKKEDIQYLDKDIRFLQKSPQIFIAERNSFFGSLLHIVGSILPFIVFFLLFFFKRKKDELESNKTLMGLRYATKTAKKRLANAKKYLDSKQSDKFYEELTAALWGYLSDKLAIPVADLTKDSARKSLTLKKIDESMIDFTLKTIDECEFARFAPSGIGFDDATAYSNAVKVIAELEANII